MAAPRKEVLSDTVTLWLGDCREALPMIGHVDAVVTDPPYELSDAGPGNAHHFGTSLSKFDSVGYKNIVSGFDHEAIFAQLESICYPFNLFCFCSNKQVSKFMAYHEERGRSTTLLVWHKVNAVPFANGVWRGDIEYVVHARDKGSVFVGNAEEKKKVSEYPLVRDDRHPTVKPLGLIEKYVKICANQGQVVLDPFCGSGTAGVACVNLGRSFIGIEREEKYFDVARSRLSEALARPRLPFGETVKPTQQALF